MIKFRTMQVTPEISTCQETISWNSIPVIENQPTKMLSTCLRNTEVDCCRNQQLIPSKLINTNKKILKLYWGTKSQSKVTLKRKVTPSLSINSLEISTNNTCKASVKYGNPKK